MKYLMYMLLVAVAVALIVLAIGFLVFDIGDTWRYYDPNSGGI